MILKIRFSSLLILLLPIQLTYGQKSEEKKVKKSFEGYKSAILHNKGEEAVKYVSNITIKYYSHILELAKTADSSKIETLSIFDKFMVFSVRHRTSKEEILSFDGKSLFIYAIKSGMVGKNNVANTSIGEVQIDSDFAKAQIISNGQKAPVYFHFYKEAGQWKLDLTSLFQISTMAFNKMAEESGENQNDFLFSLLEMMTGRKPGKEIWQNILLTDEK